MTNYSNHPEWLQNAKLSLNWFIETLGVDRWNERRVKVVSYFNSIAESEVKAKPSSEAYKPIAVYDDWMGWYMYLIENLIDRPACDEPLQSSRIIPFFSAIGRAMNDLKKVHGIDDRLQELLNERNNQPDSTLYELLVAAAYLRNGWRVSFLKETPGKGKTPDFEIRKGNHYFQVECKRLQKTTTYAESERQEWLKRWNPLAEIMATEDISLHADVSFHVPIESTGLDCLSRIFSQIKAKTDVSQQANLTKDGVTIKIRPIDVVKWATHFEEFSVRSHSPQMIHLLAGGYSPFGKYTHGIQPTSIELRGQDDERHVCNVFYSGIEKAYSAEWRSLSEESISMKARDVRRQLNKAVAQLSDKVSGIVHIGYETLEGPVVEMARHEKIHSSMVGFDPGKKKVLAIFINAMQPCTDSDGFGFDCAETTLSFGSSHEFNPDKILPDSLILQQDDSPSEDTTHWEQDYAQLQSKT